MICMTLTFSSFLRTIMYIDCDSVIMILMILLLFWGVWVCPCCVLKGAGVFLTRTVHLDAMHRGVMRWSLISLRGCWLVRTDRVCQHVWSRGEAFTAALQSGALDQWPGIHLLLIMCSGDQSFEWQCDHFSMVMLSIFEWHCDPFLNGIVISNWMLKGLQI